MLADPRFAKHRSHWRAWRDGTIPAEWEFISWVAADNMLTADGADHRRLRGLVSTAFTARRIEALRPQIVAITASLLESMDGLMGVVDLKQRLALPLPLTVIGELFGVPDSDRDRLHELCMRVFDQTISPAEAAATHEGLQAALAELVATKRQRPGPDLTSALIAARDGEDRLSETELIWTLILMVGAGFETTTNLITNAVRALLIHRGQLDLVRDGRCPWSAVIEETARWDPSIANLPFRYATEDVDLDGVRIPAGEAVLMCYASAGRDPDQHGPDADRFDITRTQRDHLAFSHGPHYCLGAPLARLESEIALCMLFDHFPDLALAIPQADLVREPSIVGSGLAALPVSLRASIRQPTDRNTAGKPLDIERTAAVPSQSTPFSMMIRHLRRLKANLMRDDITAHVNSTGSTNATLQIPGMSEEITCRTNPADEHNWWYWHGQTPLAAAHELSKAVAAIKQARTERR